MIQIETGDLLNCDAQYIVHQTNCLTWSASGLAKTLFIKYPYADIYEKRGDQTYEKIHDEPGKIYISGNGKDQRFVINAMGQIKPGGPGKCKYGIVSFNETPEMRERLFWNCLKEISQIPNLHSIAFPYLIGCNIAQGNWDHYYSMINQFSDILNKHQDGDVDVRIIKLPD